MYRRPKFLEVLHEIREKMSREADYDVDLFAKLVRNEEDKQSEVTGKIEEFDTFQSLILERIAKTKDQRPKTKK